MIGRLESVSNPAVCCFAGSADFGSTARGFVGVGVGVCPQANCGSSKTHPSNIIKRQQVALLRLLLYHVDDGLRNVFQFNKHGPLIDVEIFIVYVARVLFGIYDHFLPIDGEKDIVATVSINFRKWP